MVNIYGNSIEKVTFNISTQLKEQVVQLKDELKVSFSSIYNEAIENYIKQKELERWKKGISMALKDKEYHGFIEDISDNEIGKLPLKTIVPITDQKENYAYYPWMIKIINTPQNKLSKVSAIDCFKLKILLMKDFWKKQEMLKIL